MSAGTPAPSGCNFSHAAAGISSHDVAERLPIPGAFFTDGRRLDFAIDGVHWWRLIILAGYSRTMLAGMIAPTEATWVVIMVL